MGSTADEETAQEGNIEAGGQYVSENESAARSVCRECIWVCSALMLGLVVGALMPTSGSYEGSRFEARVSELLGWTYFFAWSTSFYPQVILNYRTKSVAGLSFEYQILNMIGFACYFAFNSMLYWSGDVQQEYREKHDGNGSAVMLNDVVFSGHALLLTIVTLSQIIVYWDYPPLSRSERCARRALIVVLLLFLSGAASLAVVVCTSSEKTLDWLQYLLVLSEAKVAISVVKYCPQVWMNHRRGSTEGWNIHNVLLDFSGGMLSVAQLLWDGWAQNDWGKVMGDPVKLLLGNVSMLFDVIFMVQHYCLYRSPRRQITAPLLPELPVQGKDQVS